MTHIVATRVGKNISLVLHYGDGETLDLSEWVVDDSVWLPSLDPEETPRLNVTLEADWITIENTE